MRKSLVIFILLLVGISAMAQPRLKTPEMYIGVRAGVMASTVMFSPSIRYMTPITNACILTPTGGLVFRYVGQKYCGIQVELDYLQRGWAEKDEDLTYSRRLHYLEIPVLMHLHFGKRAFRFTIQLGPQIGYCLKDNGGRGYRINRDGEGDEYGPTRRFDWGLAGGIGAQIRTRKAGYYELEARYNFGLGAFFSTTDTDFKTLSNPMELAFNLGWYWPIEKREKSKE